VTVFSSFTSTSNSADTSPPPPYTRPSVGIEPSSSKVGRGRRWPNGGIAPMRYPVMARACSAEAKRRSRRDTPSVRARAAYDTRSSPAATTRVGSPATRKTRLFTMRPTATPSACAAAGTVGVGTSRRSTRAERRRSRQNASRSREDRGASGTPAPAEGRAASNAFLGTLTSLSVVSDTSQVGLRHVLPRPPGGRDETGSHASVEPVQAAELPPEVGDVRTSVELLPGRAPHQLARLVPRPVPVHVLAQPGRQPLEAPGPDVVFQRRRGGHGGVEELHAHEVAEGVGREAPDHTGGPVHVLQAPQRVVGRCDADILPVTLVPLHGHVLGIQIALDHGELELEAGEDVQVRW